MGKTYIILLWALILAVGCIQDDTAHKEIRIEATYAGELTQVGLVWKKNDQLRVNSDDAHQFMVSSIEGNKATFIGNKVKGDIFDIIISKEDDFMARSYLTQEQTGTSSTSHLEFDSALIGVNSYEHITFSDDWAQSNGGEFLQSGCLLLDLRLPVNASKVTQVRIEASSPVLYATNSESGSKSSVMTLNIIKGTVGVDRTVKAYFATSMQEAVIEAGVSLMVVVETDKGAYGKVVTHGKMSLAPGRKTTIVLDSKDWETVQESKTVTFMTYNVGKFLKYKEEIGHYSYAEVASIIRQCGADVVGLNEIVDNQVQKLSAEMGEGWNYYFAPAAGYDNGNAVMASSDLKEIRRVKFDLPCVTEGYQTRSLGVVEYEDFVFCVTHLDHHNRANRVPQIRQINDWVKTNYGSSDKPVILVGDMNAIPESPEISNSSPDIEGLGKYWKAISATDRITYPSSDGGKCIDYIFIWKNNLIEYSVKKSEIVTNCPGVDVSLASDHYPVYTELTFRKKYSAANADEF
ncbi:MAG: endonuclease/exonuclease/phosphatase family protein [Bacteroidales bacterium]|nr:endonuclease/exonuclease/phosphatase family protein [Bacteroidales bacterium]